MSDLITPSAGPTGSGSTPDFKPDGVLAAIAADRVLVVVRAPRVPDPAAFCAALAAGGIHTVEFTFTTPGVAGILAEAAAARRPGTHLGAGTVLTADQAAAAIAAGAEFLVTPALRPEVAAVAARAGIPVLMGALTPTEVLTATELGAAAVKIFPAATLGPRYLADLRGPFPTARLIPSGGVNAANARAFLDHGAFAVTAGSDVVPPALVTAPDRDAELRARAAEFVQRLG